MPRTTNNRWLALLLAMSALASLALFLIPAYVIRPFRYQSKNALALAIDVKWIAPSLTLILSIAVLILTVRLWRTSSALLKTLAVIALLVSAASVRARCLPRRQWSC